MTSPDLDLPTLPARTRAAVPHGSPPSADSSHVHRSSLGVGARKRSLPWPRLSPLLVDTLMLATAAGVLAQPQSRFHTPPITWTIVFSLVVFAFLSARGMYRTPPGFELIEVCRAVVAATVLAATVTISLRVVLTDSPLVGRESLHALLVTTLLLVSGRAALTLRQRRIGRPTLIVGAGAVGRLVARRLLERPAMGLRPVGFLDKEPMAPDADSHGAARSRRQLGPRTGDSRLWDRTDSPGVLDGPDGSPDRVGRTLRATRSKRESRAPALRENCRDRLWDASVGFQSSRVTHQIPRGGSLG